MRIFISWSGQTSLQIAQELRDFLPMVLQGIEPFLTAADIDKGARWLGEITKELAASEFGVLCLTPENLASQWLAFEAGALSKHLEGRVATVLFNVGHNEVAQPLAMFQGTLFNEEEVRKLVGTINKLLPEGLKRPDVQLDKMFAAFWPEFLQSIALILQGAGANPNPQAAPSKTELMLQEVLSLLRQQNAVLSSPERLLAALDESGTERRGNTLRSVFAVERSPSARNVIKTLRENLRIAEDAEEELPTPEKDEGVSSQT